MGCFCSALIFTGCFCVGWGWVARWGREEEMGFLDRRFGWWEGRFAFLMKMGGIVELVWGKD